ncbi:hypothetical protein NT6N_17120 [Oceaniferula spumae]|uniref:Tetratricopeptide repeat protein n=1 Tax=Oceaniferula spumae TaxID=2979115 RepID=A0AAT9FL49_9BACT
MIEGKLQRADLLHDHHRYEEALALLDEVLREDPDCDQAHYQRAWNLLEIPGRKKEALDSINAAIALDPEFAYYTAIKAVILTKLDRDKEALTVAEAAIVQDPDLGIAWVAKASAYMGMNQWAKGEEAARKALELNPDDTSAANLLSLFLRLQGKLDSSQESIEQRLSEDAEDAFTHANAGWVALQRGDYKRAEEHCMESLRIDPEMEYGRAGLLESYKARSLFYRLYLKWVFFIQKYSEKSQWIIIIGIYLAFRFLRGFLTTVHPILGAAVGLLFIFFVFGSWIANGLGHFIILKDRTARMALVPSEKRDAWAVGGVLCLGILLVIAGVTVGPLGLAMGGACLMLSAIPASRVFLNGSLVGQLIFGGAALVAYGCAVGVMLTGEATYLNVAVIVCFISTWLGLVPSLNKDAD